MAILFIDDFPQNRSETFASAITRLMVCVANPATLKVGQNAFQIASFLAQE
jgi:hypothetical protein